MAKRSVMNREALRRKTVDKFRAIRIELKKVSVDPNIAPEERMLAMKKLHALPRNASPVRLHNRCCITGRGRGYYRKFGLARNKLREAAMRGDVPGLVMASW